MAGPQQCPRPRRQLQIRKRLHQIIAPRIRTGYAVFYTAARCKNQRIITGNSLYAAASSSAPTAHPSGQIQIQHHEVIVERDRHRTPLASSDSNVNYVIFSLQALPYETRKRRIIFHNQNSHEIRLTARFLNRFSFSAGIAPRTR
jgi:hypothetical protein